MKQSADSGSYLVGLAAGLVAAGISYALVGTKRGAQFKEKLLSEWRELHSEDPDSGAADLQRIEASFAQVVQTVFPQLLKKSGKKSSRSRKSSSATFKGI